MKPIIILPRGQFTSLADLTLAGLISAFVNITLISASILFVLNLLFAGVKIILSGGDKEKLDEAKRQLVNSFLGVVIVFSTWAVLETVSEFFGVNLLTFEIPTL